MTMIRNHKNGVMYDFVDFTGFGVLSELDSRRKTLHK